MEHLWIRTEDVTRVTRPEKKIARQHFAIREIQKDVGPIRRNLKSPFPRQALQLIELRRPGVTLGKVHEKVVALDQESKVRLLAGDIERLCDDPVSPRQTLLARAGPEQIQMGEWNYIGFTFRDSFGSLFLAINQT